MWYKFKFLLALNLLGLVNPSHASLIDNNAVINHVYSAGNKAVTDNASNTVTLGNPVR